MLSLTPVLILFDFIDSNTMKKSCLPVCATLFAFTLLNACAFSKSSESSSDSSKSVFNLTSSVFKSSSDSSATEHEQYENEVADYTEEFVTGTTGDLNAFKGYLSDLASEHGITNWESDHYTFVGIGRGLKQAKLGKPQISAFTESLAGQDAMKRQAIEEGLSR